MRLSEGPAEEVGFRIRCRSSSRERIGAPRAARRPEEAQGLGRERRPGRARARLQWSKAAGLGRECVSGGLIRGQGLVGLGRAEATSCRL